MLADYTDITVLLDRSASMRSIAEATREAFNGFLAEQRQVPGEARLTLVQFSEPNDYYYTFRNIPLRTEYGLTPENYHPLGYSTALRDSLVKLIDERGAEYRDTPEAGRPGKVLFVVVTDGLDNSSYFYGRSSVRERVEHQIGRYKWQFVYLGANQDAIMVGGDYGIPLGGTITYTASHDCVKNVLRSLSDETKRYRTEANYMVAFDNTAREQAVESSDSGAK